MKDLSTFYELFKSLLDYDPISGIFIWKKARQKIRIGNVAGSKNKQGYRVHERITR